MNTEQVKQEKHASIVKGSISSSSQEGELTKIFIIKCIVTIVMSASVMLFNKKVLNGNVLVDFTFIMIIIIWMFGSNDPIAWLRGKK